MGENIKGPIDMTRIFLTFSCFALLVGCQSTHQQIIDSHQTNAVDKKNIKESIKRDEYQSSGPCRTLLECAIYTKDIELATWMLEKWESERSMLVRQYVYKEDGEHQKIRYLIDAPLRYDLSDEEAASFLKLMTQHGISTNQCGLGYQTPLAEAYLKDYPLSYEVILKARKQRWRTYDTSEGYSCEYYPIDITTNTPREWLDRPSAFFFAVEHYDGSPQKRQMFTLMLNESSNILPQAPRGDRCGNYTGSSPLAYSICRGYNETATFLASYYQNTDKLTREQKKDIFSMARSLLENTPSEAELAKQQKEKADRERKELQRFTDELNEYEQAIREKAERNTRRKKAASKASEYNQSSVPPAFETTINPVSGIATEHAPHNFHLYVDEIGVTAEPKKTYFKGETCRRYPNSAACQSAPKPQPTKEITDCWEEFTGTARPGATICPE
ncbi:hypothetical protein [Vibrio parahaemolyticus]|uniref:hypothetical protein n=1 Tax=Vibrio parahaemolyticus TaxID=670 RepID=UPI00387AB25C